MDEAKKAEREAKKAAREAEEAEAVKKAELARIEYGKAIKESIESGSGVAIPSDVTALNYSFQYDEQQDWLRPIHVMGKTLRNWGVFMPPTLPAWEACPTGAPLVRLHTGCYSYLILRVWWEEKYNWVWDVSLQRHSDDLGRENTLYQGLADEPENAIRIAEWIYYALLQHRYPDKTRQLESVLQMRKNYTSQLKLRDG